MHRIRWIHRYCPICEGNSTQLVFRDRNRREGYDVETDLVQCQECSMRYLNPVPSPDDWMMHYETGHSNNRHRSQMSWTERFINHAFYLWTTSLWSRDMHLHYSPVDLDVGRILDIGCGTGEKLVHFRERGFSVYGIDVSETAIEIAVRNIEGDFRVGRFESADYPAEFFDVIRFDNVLEHIYAPREFLQKVFTLLRPGGRAFGFVPNGLSPTMRLMKKHSINSWVPFHINLFGRRTLQLLATEAGFKANVTPISNPNWVAMSVFQWLNRDKRMLNFQRGVLLRSFVGAFVAPAWWVMRQMGTGEELCLCAIRLSD